MQNALFTIARPSVCDTGGSVKNGYMQLGSRNFYPRVAQFLYFLRCKFNPEILTGSPEQGRQTIETRVG